MAEWHVGAVNGDAGHVESRVEAEHQSVRGLCRWLETEFEIEPECPSRIDPNGTRNPLDIGQALRTHRRVHRQPPIALAQFLHARDHDRSDTGRTEHQQSDAECDATGRRALVPAAIGSRGEGQEAPREQQQRRTLEQYLAIGEPGHDVRTDLGMARDQGSGRQQVDGQRAEQGDMQPDQRQREEHGQHPIAQRRCQEQHDRDDERQCRQRVDQYERGQRHRLHRRADQPQRNRLAAIGSLSGFHRQSDHLNEANGGDQRQPRHQHETGQTTAEQT